MKPRLRGSAARRILLASSWLVPRGRRRDWLERWHGELHELLTSTADRRVASPLSLVRGAWRDAMAERAGTGHERWQPGALMTDLRFALRRIRRAPVASMTIAGITALGAAAATGLFAVVDAVVLRTPPGMTAPHELLQVGRGDADEFDHFSFPNYQDLQVGTGGTVALAAFGTASSVIGHGSAAVVAPIQYASGNYFVVTGARVEAGAGFSGSADVSPEAILSAAFAVAHPEALRDRLVVVDGRPVPVVGVAESSFVGISAGGPAPALWLSFAAADVPARRLRDRGWSWLWILGRRHPGVSFPAAVAAISTVHEQLARTYRATIDDRVTVVANVGLKPPERREAVRLSSLLMSAAVLLWIAAATTSAALHFARALSEARGMAVHVAIGASRLRLLRGLVLEHLMLAAIGAVCAWIASSWVAAGIQAALPYELAVQVRPDLRTLAFALAASLVVSLTVGLAPLWSAASPDVLQGLRSGERAGARGRAAGVLVSVQVGLATALLMSAGLLARSLHAAGSAPTGFDADQVLVATIRRHPGGREPVRLREAIRERLAGLPGISAVGFATSLPLAGPHSSRTIFAAGSEYTPDARPVLLTTAWVDRGYFDVLRIRPMEGRLPEATDGGADALSVVMTSTAVTHIWPDGARPRHANSGPATLSVVGVVPDLKIRSIREPAQRVAFLPIDASTQTSGYVLIRTSAPTTHAAGALREALVDLGADVITGPVETLRTAMARSVGDTRVAAQLAVPLAALATLLAGAGLYGVSARRAHDRRREFAVRLALGATPAMLSRDVLMDAMRRVGPGLILGFLLTAALSGALRALLFGVGFADPVTAAGTAMLVAAAAAAAATAPARRVARVPPHAALRGD